MSDQPPKKESNFWLIADYFNALCCTFATFASQIRDYHWDELSDHGVWAILTYLLLTWTVFKRSYIGSVLRMQLWILFAVIFHCITIPINLIIVMRWWLSPFRVVFAFWSVCFIAWVFVRLNQLEIAAKESSKE